MTSRSTEGSQPEGQRRLLATLASLFVPGAGHLMLGRRMRGAIWLAGLLALLLIGAAHLLPGLLLMGLAALDTWWIGAPAGTPPSPKGGAR